MTVLREQAVQLVEQIPEDQIPDIIQYLHSFIKKDGYDRSLNSEAGVSPKLKAFWELEKMIKPLPELDYKKELENARNEKYGRSD